MSEATTSAGRGRDSYPVPARRSSTALTRKRIGAARDLMARARTERFAVGAFNADDLATMRAICRAAQAAAAPVLIELGTSEIEAIGVANARDNLDKEIENLGIEAYLNLDHAPTAAAAEAAVDAGFEFVHLDAFRAHPGAAEDDVVTATRRLVAYARHTDALVEGEQPDPTGPVAARAFVEATGIDLVAVGIGNVHGRAAETKLLDVELLRRIRAAVDVNLTVHGGRGTSDAAYQAVVTGGISKINVNSDIRNAYRQALDAQLASHPDEYASSELIGPVMDAVQQVIEAKVHVFGSAGKARPGVMQ